MSVYGTVAVLALGLVLSASFTGFVSALIVLFLFLIVGGTRQTLPAGLVLAVAASVLLASGFELPEVFPARFGQALAQGDMIPARTSSQEGRACGERRSGTLGIRGWPLLKKKQN